MATPAAYGMATTIAALTTPGFIGAGFRLPILEWGAMMAEFVCCRREAPWLILWPAALVAAAVLGLHLLAGRGGSTS